MRRILALTLVLSGCAPVQPAPPPPAAAAPPAPISTPTATASASPAPDAPPAVCVPKRLRTQAWVADGWMDGSQIALCLSASEKEAGCWAVDPTTAAWRTIPARTRPARWPHLSAGGTHTLDASATSVKVCKPGTADCKVISAQGFHLTAAEEFSDEIAKHMPCDVSPDGQRLLVVRHEGKRNEKIFGETYELKTGKKQSRFAIKADQHVDRVAWLGKLALLTICVDEGPGCHGVLVDTASGKALDVPPAGPGPINLFGVENPCHRVQGDLWACVAATGKEVAFIHADDGRQDALLDTGHEVSLEAGVEVVRLSADRIAIVSGAPVGGDLVVVDLTTRQVSTTLRAPECKQDAAATPAE